MSNAAEMAEYRLERAVRGQPCHLYFFETWTGYDHPIHPQHPLRWREALPREAFYKAYLCQAKFGPALVLFRLQAYERKPIDLALQPPPNGAIERFFAVAREGESISAGKEIEPQDVVDQEEYLHVVVPPQTATPPPSGELPKLIEHVRIENWYSYEYFYDDKALLLKAIIKSGFYEKLYSTTILELGKEPVVIRH